MSDKKLSKKEAEKLKEKQLKQRKLEKANKLITKQNKKQVQNSGEENIEDIIESFKKKELQKRYPQKWLIEQCIFIFHVILFLKWSCLRLY